MKKIALKAKHCNSLQNLKNNKINKLSNELETTKRELDLYINKYLAIQEKWKLIFKCTQNLNITTKVDEYFNNIISNIKQILPVDELAIVLYSDSENPKNKIFSLDYGEKADFLKMNIFSNFNFGDCEDELKAILTEEFIILPLKNSQTELGYIFMSFSAANFDKNDTGFIQALCQHISIALDQISLYKALKEENEERLKFVTGFSHELKTPLNAIIGYSEILKENTDKLDKKTLSYIDNIASGSNQLKCLMYDIIESAKLNKGTFNLRKQRFSAKDAIIKVINIFEVKLSEKNLSLRPILIDVFLDTDYTKFNQVLYNLLSNAIKFASINSEIEIISWVENEQFFFEIKNEGQIIEKKHAQKLFKFLSQGSVDVNPEGSGIGLSVSKKILKLQGGDIDFSSSKKEGTKFRFYLPCISTSNVS